MLPFFKIVPAENPILNRYIQSVRRIQNIGFIVMIFSVFLYMLPGKKLASIALLLMIPGILLSGFGISCLRSANLIKAFAQQCARNPGREIAEALLEALHRVKRVILTKPGIREVFVAIKEYEASEGADPELVAKLNKAAENTVRKNGF